MIKIKNIIWRAGKRLLNEFEVAPVMILNADVLYETQE